MAGEHTSMVKGHTMMMHTYTAELLSLPSINCLHLMVFGIMSEQDSKDQGHYDKVKGQTKAISSHCTPTPPNNVPTKYQVPGPYSF